MLPFERLAAAVRAGSLAPVYVLAGADGLQQREVLAALGERVPELGREVFDGTRCVAGDVVAALCTAGLVPGRLVVVEEPRWILAAERRPAAAGPDSGEDAGGDGLHGEDAPAGGRAEDDGDEGPLLAYLDRPAPGAVLVLRASGPVDRRRRLARKALDRGVWLDAAPPSDGGEWLRRRLAAAGPPLAPAVADALAARLEGSTCERMENELAKLRAFGPGIDLPTLDLLVPPTGGERIFDLADAAASGDRARALALAAALRSRGEPVPLRLSLLGRHLRTVARVGEACRGGARPEAVAARLGIHPYVARRAWVESRRWREEALVRAWEAVWAAEFALKSGRLAEAAALDQAVLAIVRAATPLGPVRGGGGRVVGRSVEQP